MTRRYFKAEIATSFSGRQLFFVEFEGDEPRRQVTIRDGEWFHSRVDLGRPDPDLVDQPLSEVEPSGHRKITAAEFEERWLEALARKP
jgi:hypothetical protein